MGIHFKVFISRSSSSLQLIPLQICLTGSYYESGGQAMQVKVVEL